MLDQQELADKGEKLEVNFGAAAAGLYNRSGNAAPILVARIAWPHVGPVHPELSSDLANRLLQLAARSIALAAVALADLDQQARQALEVWSKVADHALLLARSNNFGERQ